MSYRSILISVVLTIWAGLYFTLDFVPAMSAVHFGLVGQATLYVKWDLPTLLLGAGGCLQSAEPVGCFSGLMKMFWNVPGVAPRFGIVVLGAIVSAALVHRQKTEVKG